MSFATVAGLLWGLGLLGVTVGVGVRGARRGGGTPSWVVLAAALVSIPWGPDTPLTIRIERTVFAGPDLLGGEPERTVVVQDSARAGGLSRVRRERRLQGATLLAEHRRVQLRFPWIWATLLLGMALVRRVPWGPRPPRARLLLGAAAVGAVLGGCGGEEGPSPAEARLLEVMEMRRTGDVAGLESVFLPEAVYEDVPGDFEYRGVPEIAAYLGGLHEWASGVFLDVVRVRAGRESATAEWILEGIHSGPIPGRLDTITNRRFQLRGVTVVELQRGAVVRAADYLDWVPFLLDVGAEIRWPGGGITTGAGAMGPPGLPSDSTGSPD